MSLAVYQKPLIITDSGGKDSSVLVDLAIKAKIPMEIQHSHTIADAPETVRFVRDKFKRLEAEGHKCIINYPYYKGKRTSMWRLIPQKGLPPTRMVRYCCDVLKEQNGRERIVATGVRWAEGNRRKTGRGIYESLPADRSKKIILSNDNDDSRMLFENCQGKAKRVVNPLIDWADRDIWDFIRYERITVNPLYSCGWQRVGCIGCPLATRKKRLWEFDQYPEYANLYRTAFKKMLEVRKSRGKDDTCSNWETGNGVFLWWMEDKNLDGQISFDESEEGGFL
jgi:phosphoadenosine phosphosulfate reductase